MRAILTYHSLDESGSVISTSPSDFRRQMSWLAGSSVRVQALEDIVRDAASGRAADAPGDAVALTFDDGFANFATEAVPVLRDLGFPSTVFVVSTRAGLDSRWVWGDDGVPVMPLMDWDTLGGLAADKVCVGAHTRTHPRLPRIAPAALEGEIVGAADDIESRLGQRPATFAYPYGATDDASNHLAQRTFAVSCTTEFRELHRAARTSLVPRLDSFYFRAPGQLEAWHSPGFRARIRLRDGLRRVRQLLA